MKIGVYYSPKTVATSTLEKPSIKDNEALVKVSYAGICGTDMMIYSGQHPRAKAPLIMGHEFSGIVDEIGEGHDFQKGDRVIVEPILNCGKCAACKAGQIHVCASLKYIGIDKDGGFTEFSTIPVDRLRRLPDNVSDEDAALTEPLAVAIHTVRRSSLKVGDTVAILGAGPIGLLIGLIAKEAGAGDIFISDVSPYRLKVATEMGFTAINDANESIVKEVRSHTRNVGADVVFEVAGNQITADQMIDCIKFQGQIVVVSVYKKAPVVNLAAMHFREISLITTRCYSPDDFTKAIKLLEQKTFDVNPLISHILPLDEFEKGFQLMENPESSLKILFHP
ncbi:zinc-dependent alcohol dehydrogenase [Peribacillus sp. NPDC097895]|uniref:zinc-dependent alcohol dehydrogenase n=1 Tax=Peribacillus TaxID=2675229 RepID=UPI003D02413F